MIHVASEASTIRIAVAETYRETVSAYEKMDRFLDLINERTKAYKDLNTLWENLNNQIHAFITDNSQKDDLTLILIGLESLISRANSLIDKIKANPKYYQGVKTQVASFQENVDISQELWDDIKIKSACSPELVEVEKKLIKLGF